MFTFSIRFTPIATPSRVRVMGGRGLMCVGGDGEGDGIERGKRKERVKIIGFRSWFSYLASARKTYLASQRYSKNTSADTYLSSSK